MGERKENKKYTFTVEGETEKWYFEWLQNQINACPDTFYTVTIDAKVQQSPLKFAKNVNAMAVKEAVHICDYESNDAVHVRKFKDILNQLSSSNRIAGRSFRYKLGYSNFTFELWIVLHKANCNGSFADRRQYLKPINRAFNENFEDLDQYKHEKNFKRCLSKMNIEEVKTAIFRSKQIMRANQDNGLMQQKHKGFEYYTENPSLTVWESVEGILKTCKLL